MLFCNSNVDVRIHHRGVKVIIATRGEIQELTYSIPIDLAFHKHTIASAKQAQMSNLRRGTLATLLTPTMMTRATAPFNTSSHEPTRGCRIILASAIFPLSPTDASIACALFVNIVSTTFKARNKRSQNIVLD